MVQVMACCLFGANLLPEQRWSTVEPYIKATLEVAFQKSWPVMRGKINIICIEWCIEMYQILQL